MHISVYHISGKNNDVADLRWTGSQQDLYQINTFILEPVWMLAQVDLTMLNHYVWYFRYLYML